MIVIYFVGWCEPEYVTLERALDNYEKFIDKRDEHEHKDEYYSLFGWNMESE